MTTNTFFVSTAGAHVRVDSDAPEVRALIEREIGHFFRVDDAPAGELTLGRVTSSRSAYKGGFQGKGRPVLLHDGSHSYDLRRAVEYRNAGRRVVESHDTGSVLAIDDIERTVHLHNEMARTLAVDTRRLVRDQLFVPWLESRGAVTYHAAAFVLGGIGFLAPGSRGAGKTSVFMSAMTAEVAGSFLSCERILAIPEGDRFVLHACPENISIFAGTLAQFRQTREMAAPVPTSAHWTREAKIQVPWRRLFELFQARPVAEPAPLSVLLFPRYERDLTEDPHTRELDPDETARLLRENQVTELDANRPNWLGWYLASGTADSAERLARLPALALRWSHPEALRRWFTGGRDHLASRALTATWW